MAYLYSKIYIHLLLTVELLLTDRSFFFCEFLVRAFESLAPIENTDLEKLRYKALQRMLDCDIVILEYRKKEVD